MADSEGVRCRVVQDDLVGSVQDGLPVCVHRDQGVVVGGHD
jgi:hypothetical protein